MESSLDKKETLIGKSEKPLVSVNICTYNRANLIKKAIESVLWQDYPNIEIIISDGGSDNTKEIVEEIKSNSPKYQIKYFKPNLVGISTNRNFAFSKSNGKYIAVLDSDDFWTSSKKISQQVKFLEENSDHAVVGTNAIIVNEKDEKIDEILNESSDKKIRSKFLLKNHFIHSSVMIRRDNFIEYNEGLPVWEDYDLFLKIAIKSKVANIPEKMTAYKKHGSNISSLKKVRGVRILAKIIRQNKKYYPNYYVAEIKNLGRMLRATLLPF